MIVSYVIIFHHTHNKQKIIFPVVFQISLLLIIHWCFVLLIRKIFKRRKAYFT